MLVCLSVDWPLPIGGCASIPRKVERKLKDETEKEKEKVSTSSYTCTIPFYHKFLLV